MLGRQWLWFPAAFLLAFVLLNLNFLRFLRRRRGLLLALVAVPLHVLHNLAGAAGFALALAGHAATAVQHRAGRGVARPDPRLR